MSARPAANELPLHSQPCSERRLWALQRRCLYGSAKRSFPHVVRLSRGGRKISPFQRKRGEDVVVIASVTIVHVGRLSLSSRPAPLSWKMAPSTAARNAKQAVYTIGERQTGIEIGRYVRHRLVLSFFSVLSRENRCFRWYWTALTSAAIPVSRVRL